jgi:hypothetical protein
VNDSVLAWMLITGAVLFGVGVRLAAPVVWERWCRSWGALSWFGRWGGR